MEAPNGFKAPPAGQTGLFKDWEELQPFDPTDVEAIPVTPVYQPAAPKSPALLEIKSEVFDPWFDTGRDQDAAPPTKHAAGDRHLPQKASSSNKIVPKSSFAPKPPPAVKASEEEESGEPSHKAPRLEPQAKKVSFKPPPPLEEEQQEAKGEEEADCNEEEELLDDMLEQLEEEKEVQLPAGFEPVMYR